ncbi:hypothetical protein SSX86_015704 [Deinandra increscens subsp. villosa]|uniref:TCP domain-containing protein n=1 Tax=Deinandra increscens subsp. villosa TaxID=3103831 RepID=A0AAP0CWR2_9ASTR
MEVDEGQKKVSKFQRISYNGSSISDSSSNPNRTATDLFPVGGDGGRDGVGRLGGWPSSSSRIVRVSRGSSGKDRHSKVVTSKGLRDRRIRLSVTTAIEFYDLQDRLGYDQPSKAVEWLINAAASSIAELPSLDLSFPSGVNHVHHRETQLRADNKSSGYQTEFEDPNHQTNLLQKNNNSNSNSNSNNNNNCSSTSETSKGSGLSFSRSENRIRARERARGMVAKKEKEKESSSFTDLLTGGMNSCSHPPVSTESRIHWTSPTDYFHTPQFNIPDNIEDNEHHQHQHQHQQNQFSFLQDNFVTADGGGLASGLNRGTLQSNLLSSSSHHHHQIQRFQPSLMVDGSISTNFPFFIAPAISSGACEHFPAIGYGGGGGGSRHSGHYSEKSKN